MDVVDELRDRHSGRIGRSFINGPRVKDIFSPL
jgi:hypothetical protein